MPVDVVGGAEGHVGHEVAGDVEDDEARGYERAARPYTPTTAELEEHLPLHLNYRDWCEDCVGAKALAAPHKSDHSEPLEGVTWNMDYCFLGDKLDDDIVEEESEEKQRGKLPVLVVYDDDKEALWTLPAGQKGANEASVKWGVDRLEDSGYLGKSITIKSDQEESIVALRRAISVARVGDTVPINSPVRCSKSNGKMERAVRTFQGQLRVLKFHFERRIGKLLPCSHPLFSWLVVWTSEMLNKFKVKSDGRTVYEKLTNHKCKHMIVGFGEHVQWQQIQDKNARDKVNGDWRDGIFLGAIWRTTEYIIGTPDGVFKCRTIKTRVAENSYDAACLEYIKTSYADYALSGAKSQGARVKFADPAAEPPPREPAFRAGNEFVPRKIYLKPGDFGKYGFTDGCPGCVWLQNKIGARRNHSDECRLRVEQAIGRDPEEKHRIDIQNSKMDTFSAAEGARIHQENGGQSNGSSQGHCFFRVLSSQSKDEGKS